MQRVIAYIDGFNLYYGLKNKQWQRFYWLDIPELARNLLKPGQELTATKYFTSRISSLPSDPAKVKRQNTYLEALLTRTNLSILYGHYLVNEQVCRKCGAKWYKPSEKMTDVNIATEMLADAYQNRFDTALLISGDSDLTGPIRAVLRDYPEKRVVVAFPPDRRSATLAQAASYSFQIGRAKVAESQLPDEIKKPDGFLLKRPSRWS